MWAITRASLHAGSRVLVLQECLWHARLDQILTQRRRIQRIQMQRGSEVREVVVEEGMGVGVEAGMGKRRGGGVWFITQEGRDEE